MFNISKFFSRINSSFGKEIILRTAICSAIKKHTGIDIQIGDLTIKSGIVNVNGVSQSARSAIFIKKQAILKELEGLKGGGVRDVR